jgi:hypothetical protein
MAICNEGAEGLNSMASKRYDMFNNKGGHKSTSKGEMKVNCRPFEVLSSWLSRLTMWHIGMADVMFVLESTEYIVWDPDSSTYYSACRTSGCLVGICPFLKKPFENDEKHILTRFQ